MIAPDEADETEWPVEADPLAGSVLPMIEAIFTQTHDGSPERAAAMGELMSAVERIRAALKPKPRMN
jgi:hypothetical protein